MQVSPINNNVSTKGRFIKNVTLNRMLEASDNNTLKRFKDITERAKRVNDGNIFKISSLITTEQDNVGKPYKNYHFHLLKSTEENEFIKSTESKISFTRPTETKKEEIFSQTPFILNYFLNTLEKFYPQGNNKNIRDFLMAEINDNLIEE